MVVVVVVVVVVLLVVVVVVVAFLRGLVSKVVMSSVTDSSEYSVFKYVGAISLSVTVACANIVAFVVLGNLKYRFSFASRGGLRGTLFFASMNT